MYYKGTAVEEKCSIWNDQSPQSLEQLLSSLQPLEKHWTLNYTKTYGFISHAKKLIISYAILVVDCYKELKDLIV